MSQRGYLKVEVSAPGGFLEEAKVILRDYQGEQYLGIFPANRLKNGKLCISNVDAWKGDLVSVEGVNKDEFIRLKDGMLVGCLSFKKSQLEIMDDVN